MKEKTNSTGTHIFVSQCHIPLNDSDSSQQQKNVNFQRFQFASHHFEDDLQNDKVSKDFVVIANGLASCILTAPQ